jgi:hypothetical protein
VSATPPTSPSPGSGAEPEAVPERPPLLRVITPDATPQEIAALVAVFLLNHDVAAAGHGRALRTPEWSAHHRKVRATYPHGPGGWRSSGLPR